jgi:2-phospho-L-lactate guanylyltransferase
LRVFAIVPVKSFERAKSRLASILEVAERAKLSELLLEDTLTGLNKSSSISEVVVVSSDRRAQEISNRHSAIFLREHEDCGVNRAIAFADSYCNKAQVDATIVIPQDLPLLRPIDIDMLCTSVEEHESCLVICPSMRYDGSNFLLRRPPMLVKTWYDNNSFYNHIKEAKEKGAELKIILSPRIMTDLDTVEDAQNLIEGVAMTESILYLKMKLNETNVEKRRQYSKLL